MPSSADAGGRERVTGRDRRVTRDPAGPNLDEVLNGAPERLTETARTGDRLRALLDAVLVVSGDLDLDSTLRRVVRAAMDLVGACDGALGVLGPDGSFSDVVHEHADPRVPARDGRLAPGEAALRSVLDEPGRRRNPAELGVRVRVRDGVFGALYLTGKRGGGEFGPDDEIVLRSLAAAAGVAVENAGLLDRSRARERWLEAVAAINAELLAGASLADSLHRIAESARELSHAAVTAVLLTGTADEGATGEDAAGETLSVGAVSGGPPGSPEVGAVFPAGAVLAEAIRTVEAKVVPDLGTATATLPSPLATAFGPAVVSPLRSAAGVKGLLLAARRKGEAAFPDRHVRLVSSFAAQATLALEFADKQDSDRELALLADRDRIAQDLHDRVIQRLFATGMELQGVLRQVSDAYAYSRISDAVERLDRTVRDIRTAIFDLHSMGETGERGLRRRLLDVVARLSDETGVPASVRIGGAVDTLVPDATAEQVEAVVHDGVGEAVRLPGVRDVALDVDVGDVGEVVAVEITVDGAGPPREPWLDGPRRRAHACGGDLAVEHDPSGVTRVTWTVPLAGPGRDGTGEPPRRREISTPHSVSGSG